DKKIIMENSISYAKKFGIDVSRDPFPWFLLSILFGARISEEIASRTFYLFKREGIISPEKILETGWDGLVVLLDSGGYTRYDFKTATKLISVSENIIREGGLKKIHDESVDPDEFVRRLKSISKGIGDVTIGIFMREMVDVWEKARPMPSYYARLAMENLSLDVNSYRDLGIGYSIYEYFLHRVGKNCYRGRCEKCPVRNECKKFKNKLLKNE
ncbi:MAG: hypothetical protein ACP5G5_05145, partial [Thermoplasmata archaeon]